MKTYTKKQANYRKARFSSKNKCKNCIFFYKKSNGCAVVKGYISAEAVCDYHRSNKR